ncbi:hypothetical protein AWB75_04238 [Caballeronia catudaia]|uniref:Uncharacterized protein n=1 Tax=Caballeronia catudaia TaxID=1777136 RepID=A0A158BZD6_9BURK|nr:hypothetical protein [Caballeronia catudaia]SAK75340.1 hypothetical protein AWB75_04238 [Caballeronia catudaia]
MSGLDVRSLKVSRPVLGLLVVALGLILYTYFRGEPAEAPEAPAPARAVPKAPAAASAPAASAVETADAQRPAAVDIFPSQNWQPPPPPPPPAPLTPPKPPPPPEPPPLPFAVRSLWLDQDGVFYVLLSGTGREFTLCANCQKKNFLKKGDVILNAYRIEDINRKEVRFIYLPLKRRQTLALGELK